MCAGEQDGRFNLPAGGARPYQSNLLRWPHARDGSPVYFDLDYYELKDLSRNCLEYSFLAGASLFEGRDYGKHKATAPDSDKARAQALLEAAFERFENALDGGYREVADP